MQVTSPRVLNAPRYSMSLLLPLVAIAYIVFCYTVHYKTVPVRSGGLFDDSPANLGTSYKILKFERLLNLSSADVIKSGVTSISTIIIGLGLLPVYSLIADPKVGFKTVVQSVSLTSMKYQSEGFFRLTRTRRSGALLGYINGISSPSFGIIDSVMLVVYRYCSPYFVLVIVATILALVVSTLAPAAHDLKCTVF